jgi:hypothetical protein
MIERAKSLAKDGVNLLVGITVISVLSAGAFVWIVVGARKEWKR